MNKKIIIKRIVLFLIITAIVAVFMIVKGLPIIAESQMNSAFNEQNGEKVFNLYQKYYYDLGIGYSNVFLEESITDCVDEFVHPIYNDFNTRFSDYQSEEEMINYLKNEYGTLFIDQNNSFINEYAFSDLKSLLDSKIDCISKKEALLEFENEINQVKQDIKEFEDEFMGIESSDAKDLSASAIHMSFSIVDLMHSFNYSTLDVENDDLTFKKLKASEKTLITEWENIKNDFEKKYSNN